MSQTLGQYEILEFLGKGGFGEVWKARDTRLNRIVAIKRLPESLLNDPERRERLRREALAASSLNHPNICTIHDLAEIGSEHVLVMEYIDGKTLHETLAAGPLPANEAIAITLQIADALGEAHRHSIIHRDIKSSNIMITPRKQVKVLDFGLARPVVSDVGDVEETEARLTRSGVTLGTVHYMSPEQLLGLTVDGRSDLFSLGVVLYELLTGRLPFEGSSMIAISDAILHRAPLPASSVAAVPLEIDRILERLLAKKRDERYPDAEEVIRDLSVFVSGEVQTARPGKRSSAVPWSIAAGVVLLAGVLLVPAWQKWSRQRWATQTAIPEVARLVEADRFTEAVRIARTAQSIVPDDPRLKNLWSAMTLLITADSNPTGANVYFAKYGAPENEWELLGRTPLKDAAAPRGTFYRWKLEKKGYLPAYRVGPWWGFRFRLKAVLDREGTIPPGMVHVPAGQFELSIPGLDHLDPVQLGDFLIDKFEVTNADYKKFVDAGGYQKREYWKQPFVKDGHPVPFETAMGEFVDSTGSPGPATWEVGDFPKGQADNPVGGVSWFEAAAYAEFAGKRLPTIFHWNGAAQTQTSPVVVPASNFGGHGPWAPGSHRSIGQYGAYDMAGNLKEWCSNEAEPGKRYILGGAWNEPNYMFIDQDAQNVWARPATFGFRTMKVLSADGIPRDAERAIWIPLRDFSKEKPASDEVFEAYRSLYSYDRTPLNAVIESTDPKPESWTVQKISFDAAYGNERVLAYLYLPKNARPPYQTVIFFPGSNAIHTDSIGSSPGPYGDFVPKSGRALMFPIYKGTYERRDKLTSDYPAMTAFYRDHVIAWAKDLRRSIDYLETRSDIDHGRFAFDGMSWGGEMGPLMAAVEPRIKTCIFISGGFDFQHSLPEADIFNFAPRMKQPVLMLNARYDHFFPVETSQLPMLRTIGTPEADKKYVVYESGHAPPRLEVTKESLAWLDRYLGPVRR
ncbi:MAG TPA: protein kinase [Thermoanaerobaculia bacterium]|nr:protein kinase [Thermoanaerobaculia bacterium]